MPLVVSFILQVHHFVMTRVIPKIPEKAKELTLLLQAKVELVAELRWMVSLYNEFITGCERRGCM